MAPARTMNSTLAIPDALPTDDSNPHVMRGRECGPCVYSPALAKNSMRPRRKECMVLSGRRARRRHFIGPVSIIAPCGFCAATAKPASPMLWASPGGTAGNALSTGPHTTTCGLGL